MVKEKSLEENISEKFQEWFQINSQLLDLANAALQELDNRKLIFEQLNYFEGIFIVFFPRCRKKFKAIQLLCRKGYGDGAGLILRSMINALIDICYIETDPVPLSERYMRYDFVIRKRKLDILDKYFDPASNIPTTKDTSISKEDILKGYEEFKNDYSGSLADWSGLQIKEKADKAKEKFPAGIGKHVPAVYDFPYRYYSDYEHNNIMALSKHISEEKEGKIVILCDPSEDGVQMTLKESFLTFIQLFNLYCDAFKLKYSSRINELTDHFKRLI